MNEVKFCEAKPNVRWTFDEENREADGEGASGFVGGVF